MEQEPTRLPRRSWHIAWLLGLGVLVNYFDRVNLSVSHESLIAAFGISNIAFGYLSGAYNWTYAFCQLPIGVLLDRFGVKRIGRVSTFLWSIASFCAAASPGIPTLFASRLLLGVGEAPTFPGECQGDWAVVSAEGAQFRHLDLRRGGEVFVGAGCPGAGDHSAEDWVALELRADRPAESSLLPAFLEGVSGPGRRFDAE
jgi:hypothetical protein